ncbi:MAG: NADH-quinone oxidoreductase subunit N [Bacteroidetes bacterium]|nr:NADH-quinone oxidoreductase subunit N [Bacteroidota bacterium]
MNLLLLAAFWGVLMMFLSVLGISRSRIRLVAQWGMGLLFLSTAAEMQGFVLYDLNAPEMLRVDRYALVLLAILSGCGFLYFLLSATDMAKVGSDYSEYFALIFFVFCGFVLVLSFTSLLMLFLGIEIVTIPLYILTGADKRNLKSNEASLKYFLLGAFSTGLMLMGITMVYGARGSFSSMELVGASGIPTQLLLGGLFLMLFSMAFKVSVAPFHFWTPDVYDGAPTVFTSFMATLVKVAAFAGFFRLFDHAFTSLTPAWQVWAGVLSVCTLMIGNITAVFQQSVKRLLAYSSIAQAGFMMLGIYGLGGVAKEGMVLYAASYSLATIGIFAVLTRMQDYTLEGFNGLAKERPWVAASLTIFLLSLAGIPLTAGFLAKFYMLQAAVEAKYGLAVVIVSVLMAAVSVYYYFRILQAMYFRERSEEVSFPVFSSGFVRVLMLLAALILVMGVQPGWLLRYLYF